MSRLTEIYAALAAVPVSVADRTPIVYGYDAAPSAVTTAQLPCRVLMPGRLDAQAATALTLGGGQVIRWRLTDLLLWAPTGQGRGLAEHNAALVAYCAAYAAAVYAGKALDTSASSATVVSVTCEPAPFAYPPGRSSLYYGVECAVTVEEIA